MSHDGPSVTLTVGPLPASAAGLRGTVTVPGDKSVSHRSLLLNLLAHGTATVRGLLRGEDVLCTLRAVQALGATVEDDGEVIRITGAGGALREPQDVVDCGNSGTTMRLLTGICAAAPQFTVLTGDNSLRGRPMARVVHPLRALGAQIDGRDAGDRAPLAVRGAALAAPDGVFRLSVASAQVKTALLLALRQHGVTICEPGLSRDHTERMLRAMGAELTTTVQDNGEVWHTLAPVADLAALDVDVPGDLSSAAFWMVAASIVPGSVLRLKSVGLNPTRAGVVDALRAMGADLTVQPLDAAGAEPLADVTVRSAPLQAIRLDGELALRCLDELPILAVAASRAEGTSVFADAAELRVKESDRIETTVAMLRAFGADVQATPDGMVITGGPLDQVAEVQAHGDHRIAMAAAVAALASSAGVTVHGAEAIATSYPDFERTLRTLMAGEDPGANAGATNA